MYVTNSWSGFGYLAAPIHKHVLDKKGKLLHDDMTEAAHGLDALMFWRASILSRNHNGLLDPQ